MELHLGLLKREQEHCLGLYEAHLRLEEPPEHAESRVDLASEVSLHEHRGHSR